MKYLIVGLGNIGDEYAGTRHNIGFMMIDAFAASVKAEWQDKRYGFVAKCRVKNAELVLLKPSTYMNLSGNAVRYWLGQEKIPVENMLVLVDDLNLPFGTIRLRKQGSDGGHNGLGNIQSVMGTENYARLRFRCSAPSNSPVCVSVSAMSSLAARRSILYWVHGPKRRRKCCPSA